MTPQIADSDLIREVRELRERLDKFPVPTQSFEGSLPAVKIKKDPAKTNYKLNKESCQFKEGKGLFTQHGGGLFFQNFR